MLKILSSKEEIYHESYLTGKTIFCDYSNFHDYIKRFIRIDSDNGLDNGLREGNIKGVTNIKNLIVFESKDIPFNTLSTLKKILKADKILHLNARGENPFSVNLEYVNIFIFANDRLKEIINGFSKK